MGKLQFGNEFSMELKWENCNLVTSFQWNSSGKIAIWLQVFNGTQVGKLQFVDEFSGETKRENCNLVASFQLKPNGKIAIWWRVFK
ncbi:hypothetical protein pv_143 [Pithovirus sibericum]|uniref:Uncharacterized protein n=1 Tax=Pithovirus sibericum TaxID=1450746 RepID=W5SAC7_9VIRU|nr:hypothetical protein pv_143 [Pithovirus sibericum]AHH01710.1 hypothetical protein pv_143 [Pithovirus sibericum]